MGSVAQRPVDLRIALHPASQDNSEHERVQHSNIWEPASTHAALPNVFVSPIRRPMSWSALSWGLLTSWCAPSRNLRPQTNHAIGQVIGIYEWTYVRTSNTAANGGTPFYFDAITSAIPVMVLPAWWTFEDVARLGYRPRSRALDSTDYQAIMILLASRTTRIPWHDSVPYHWRSQL